MRSSRRTNSIPLLVLCVALSTCKKEKNTIEQVASETIQVDSLEQIVPLADTLVKPLLYTHVKGLKHLPVREAKNKFVAAILPSILVAGFKMEAERNRFVHIKKKKEWSADDSAVIAQALVDFKAADIDDLIYRMGALPNSVVLAQAAVESGWGQSRFFLEGNNLFGVWSFNKYEPRLEAGKTRNKKRIYLRSYANISESIEHYFHILSSKPPYKSLREARHKTNDPFELLPHLQNFSERRLAYTNQLKKLIIVNDFTRYDKYILDPAFIEEIEID